MRTEGIGREGERVAEVNTSLEAVVEVALTTATGEDLSLHDVLLSTYHKQLTQATRQFKIEF